VVPQGSFTAPNWNECRFSFATVFSTFGGEPKVITTGLIPLPSQNATINFTQPGWEDKCTFGNCADQTWLQPINNLRFKVKPNIIQVVVTHFGDSVFTSGPGVYNSLGNDQAHLVDTIAINIANITPAASNVSPVPIYSVCVNGDQKGSNGYQLSTLTLLISVNCRDGFQGNYCNMTNCTTYNNNTQVCMSSIYPGQFLVCGYDNNNMQPVNCTMCGYGVQDGQCRSADSFHRLETANVTGYIVGIAILAILLAIAIVIIIVGAITYRDKNRPLNRRTVNQPPPSNTTATGWFGTKNAKQATNGTAPTRTGYTQAATEEPADSEWVQPPLRPPVSVAQPQQQGPRPYNFPPPPARPGESTASTPERNGSRREAAV